MRCGLAPRVVLLDIAELPAPIAEVRAARAAGGADLGIVVLGTVNDVGSIVTCFRPAQATISLSRQAAKHSRLSSIGGREAESG